MEDIKYVYGRAFKRFGQYVGAIPVLAAASILYAVILGVVEIVFSKISLGSLSILIGFLKWGITLATMAHFAGLILTLNSRGKLRFEDIKNFDSGLMAPLSQVYFILYLIQYAVAKTGLTDSVIGLIVFSIFDIFLIPIYEVVYLGRKTGLEAFNSLLEYWKANWKPLLVFVSICIFITIVLSFLPIIGGLGLAFGGTSIVNAIAITPYMIMATIILSILRAVYLLFKSILFQETYFSNPRSRQFRRN